MATDGNIRCPDCETVVSLCEWDFNYGGYPVGELARVDLAPFAALLGGELVGPEGLLFLDTETTGLSGGSGTVAFLIGAGHFCENGFIIKQYLMRDYDEELSALQNLAVDIGGRGTLVTYNGKAFDINLLATRFIMNGMRFPRHAGHLDLLHPARRVWRNCLTNCRLTTLEREVLGSFREGDIPGSLIPQVYFDFLRTGERGTLNQVLQHNKMDIIAMAAILKYVSDLAARAGDGQPESGAARAGWTPGGAGADESSGAARRRKAREGEELLGLAGFFEAAGDSERAERCLLRCLGGGAGPSVARRGLALLSAIKKRKSDYRAAVEYWVRLLEFSPRCGLYPYIELAKYYEHKARDPARAKEYADRAQTVADGAAFADARARRELTARRERLRRKLAHENR